MPTEGTTTWTVTVAKSTDAALRARLAQTTDPATDVSTYVEDAVRWRLLDQSLDDARDAFADLSAEQAQALIDAATDAVRADLKRESIVHGDEIAQAPQIPCGAWRELEPPQ
jgi:hypothetical protein